MNELAQVTHGLEMEGAMETSRIGSERAVTDYQCACLHTLCHFYDVSVVKTSVLHSRPHNSCAISNSGRV